MSVCYCCPWQNDCAVQWCERDGMGIWRWILTVEEGGWSRDSLQQCYLLYIWAPGRCRGITQIQKKLWWVLDWWMVLQASELPHTLRCYLISHELQMSDKIIPTFEAAHGARYRVLFLIDNSQGHSAYAEDALQVSNCMNIKPGGKQAQMRKGWFIHDGIHIEQDMVYPPNHPSFPNQPKGIRAVLMEWGLWQEWLCGKCHSKCDTSTTTCCNMRILKSQPDFSSQKPLVQEIIEAAGHTCLFLPKFHYELNFIEYFWGSVKKHLRDHADGSFNTLKANLLQALASVQLCTIWLWEQCMHHWVEAYRSGLPTKEAQIEVRKYSSTVYKSHRHVPEATACIFDGPII